MSKMKALIPDQERHQDALWLLAMARDNIHSRDNKTDADWMILQSIDYFMGGEDEFQFDSKRTDRVSQTQRSD
jgi:hypothetical protein